jgi:hypothetical protein
MHPAFSVIFFTVASGAGFGLFSLLFIADFFKLGGGFNQDQLVAGGLLAMGLVVFGLLSSTFHLANPKNAWRAISRFRTSWLSREGVFAVVFMPLALIYLASIMFDAPQWLRVSSGFLTAVLAWITVFSTGMIYACLKTIRQWNTPLVPANYLALGYASGSLLLLLGAVIAGLDTTALHRDVGADHLDRRGAEGDLLFLDPQPRPLADHQHRHRPHPRQGQAARHRPHPRHLPHPGIRLPDRAAESRSAQGRRIRAGLCAARPDAGVGVQPAGRPNRQPSSRPLPGSPAPRSSAGCFSQKRATWSTCITAPSAAERCRFPCGGGRAWRAARFGVY